MTTANDLITQSLRDLGYLAREETASGADSADALATLNTMLHEWGAEMSFGHVDLSLADTIQLPDADVLAVQKGLAITLGFGVTPSQLLVAQATGTKGKMRARRFDIDDVSIPEGLMATPRQRRGRFF